MYQFIAFSVVQAPDSLSLSLSLSFFICEPGPEEGNPVNVWETVVRETFRGPSPP